MARQLEATAAGLGPERVVARTSIADKRYCYKGWLREEIQNKPTVGSVVLHEKVRNLFAAIALLQWLVWVLCGHAVMPCAANFWGQTPA